MATLKFREIIVALDPCEAIFVKLYIDMVFSINKVGDLSL
jgi:hypothetical protein